MFDGLPDSPPLSLEQPAARVVALPPLVDRVMAVFPMIRTPPRQLLPPRLAPCDGREDPGSALPRGRLAHVVLRHLSSERDQVHLRPELRPG